MNDAIIRFHNTCAQCEELFAEKNELYGNSIVETGVLGAVVELVGITARLKKIVLRSADAGEGEADKLQDILMDAHNYSGIALMMLNDGNFRGYGNG